MIQRPRPTIFTLSAFRDEEAARRMMAKEALPLEAVMG